MGSVLEAVHKLVARIESEKVEQKMVTMTDRLTKKSYSQPDEQRLTTAEVAEYFGRHRKTIEKWARERGLPCKHHGRNLIFRRGDVLRWQAQQER